MLWNCKSDKIPGEIVMQFSSSLSFDVNLFEYDIKVSKAHVKMLKKCKIISDEECEKILKGLEKVKVHFRSEFWKPDPLQFEDIHSAIEVYLTELIGEVAGKIHSGRSRNDLVVTSFRLWIKDNVNKLKSELNKFYEILSATSTDHVDTIMPGYTHLQRAQPVSLGFHLTAYQEMIKRDLKRIDFLLEEVDEMPLGSGALAGSTLPLDRQYCAELLGFNKVSVNAMDAVSDRDFVIDFHNCLTTGMMHLSRLAEELILWSTSEFDFIKIDEAYTTGSSLMPQKKNPDMAELIRGKTGRVLGNYVSVLTMMKGLCLSYNRDMQEDKEAVFDGFNTYFFSIKIMSGMIETMQVNKNRFIDELNESSIFATDLADKLVADGVPFRKAHKLVNELVQKAESKKGKLSDLSEQEIESVVPGFSKKFSETIQIDNCLNNKKTFGSPNPEMIHI